MGYSLFLACVKDKKTKLSRITDSCKVEKISVHQHRSSGPIIVKPVAKPQSDKTSSSVAKGYRSDTSAGVTQRLQSLGSPIKVHSPNEINSLSLSHLHLKRHFLISVEVAENQGVMSDKFPPIEPKALFKVF